MIFQIPKSLNTIMTDTLHMAEVTISNVKQLISRTVKSDGRAGGMQPFAGKSVDIIIYEEEHEVN